MVSDNVPRWTACTVVVSSDGGFVAYSDYLKLLAEYERLLKEQTRLLRNHVKPPHEIWRPVVMKEGTQWCALYGESLQAGISGFGDTPAQAIRAYDEAWEKP